MIEVASHPKDLGTWTADLATPYYLEFFGETRPILDTNYAALTDHPDDKSCAAPIYEYWWTIGHPGYREHGDGAWKAAADHLLPAHESPSNASAIWTNLDKTAARVYVFFPTWGGWRIKEVVAAVKYLSPVATHLSWLDRFAQEWQHVQPLVDDASQVAGAIPTLGAAGKGLASTLSVLAKMKLNSVPQTDGFEWSVGKVTFAPNGKSPGVMQGVMWTLPRAMFAELGGRLTGSLALNFIESGGQGASVGSPDGEPTMLPIKAHAVIYSAGKEYWAPSVNEFVELQVQPRRPTPTSAKNGA